MNVILLNMPMWIEIEKVHIRNTTNTPTLFSFADPAVVIAISGICFSFSERFHITEKKEGLIMYLLLSLLIFELILTFHEFGHFLMAKKYGIPVTEFSIGVGPLLFSFEKGGTKYCLRLFPIGGYNQIDDKTLDEAPLKVQNIVFVAGAAFNFITAFIAVCIFTLINGGNPVSEFFKYFFRTFQALFMLVTGQFSSEDMGGYGAMLGTMSSIISQPTFLQTFSAMLRLYAVLSVYIGIFNLLPVYPLDGGQIIAKTINAYRPDTLKPKVLNTMAFVVFGLLIATNILLTLKDFFDYWS